MAKRITTQELHKEIEQIKNGFAKCKQKIKDMLGM